MLSPGDGARPQFEPTNLGARSVAGGLRLMRAGFRVAATARALPYRIGGDGIEEGIPDRFSRVRVPA